MKADGSSSHARPASAMLLLVIAFVLIGSHLGSRHSTQICLALFFPQAPPPLLPSPFFSDETDATLQSLLRHPVGGSCMGGVSGFSGDWASQRSVVDSLRILEKWRGDARTRPRRRLHRCRVCSLLQHTFGYEIDRADWVIRINDAPTPVSLHAYVGRRTDVVVKTHETLTHLEGFHALPAQAGVLRVYYCHVPWVSRCWMEAAHDGYERLSPRLITWARQISLAHERSHGHRAEPTPVQLDASLWLRTGHGESAEGERDDTRLR